MDRKYRKLLEKQQYAFVGDHSAVKICTWTKKSLRGEGVCYKEKFYGIRCHLCAQISPVVNFCDMNCVYCWRDRHNEEFKKVDEPSEIIDNTIKMQNKLLSGFGGLSKVDKDKLKLARWIPQHFAISLTGETLYYPKISELIAELKKRKLTSFVVTNGMLPDVLKKMTPPTQLYISIDAPNEKLHRKICKPLHKDSWQRLMKSLDVLKDLRKKTRTTLRLTIIKGINDIDPEGYAALITRSNPMFIEVKAYMYVGASREKLAMENMPRHIEVREFAEKIAVASGYKIIDEQSESRVVLLMKRDFPTRMMKF